MESASVQVTKVTANDQDETHLTPVSSLGFVELAEKTPCWDVFFRRSAGARGPLRPSEPSFSLGMPDCPEAGRESLVVASEAASECSCSGLEDLDPRKKPVKKSTKPNLDSDREAARSSCAAISPSREDFCFASVGDEASIGVPISLPDRSTKDGIGMP